MMKAERRKKRKLNRLIAFTLGLILVAVLIQAVIVYWINNKNTSKTSEVLLDRVVNVIEKNAQNEQDMIGSLKEDYIVRAKAAAYIIDAKPEVENDATELKKIAELLAVDEIHLLDDTGTIYSGTVPKYYGYSFDSGEQMAYFKPMLADKELTMCQDVTPNTSEGKQMMYAITWDEQKKCMVQVGIEPVRLLKELKQNEISSVVENMPVYEGIQIFVAEKESGKICAATDESYIGKKLDDIGIIKKSTEENEVITGINRINGKNYRCTFRITGQYAVGVVCSMAFNTESNVVPLLIVGIYLGLAAVCIIFMFIKVSRAKIDELTGCLNRKAYKEDISALSVNEEFVYATLDVNALKWANDTLGHAAGDELLQGTAECMKQCFGSYGKIYRIGGDEFACILFMDNIKLKAVQEDFAQVVRGWSGTMIHELSISAGYVYSRERRWESLEEITSEADLRMYKDKEKYYCVEGRDRRRK